MDYNEINVSHMHGLQCGCMDLVESLHDCILI